LQSSIMVLTGFLYLFFCFIIVILVFYGFLRVFEGF
jgi:hypothetical protein